MRGVSSQRRRSKWRRAGIPLVVLEYWATKEDSENEQDDIVSRCDRIDYDKGGVFALLRYSTDIFRLVQEAGLVSSCCIIRCVYVDFVARKLTTTVATFETEAISMYSSLALVIRCLLDSPPTR